MNRYNTSEMIKILRERKHITQSQLADILSVSDKTISKWETGKGLPDISIIEPLSKALDISISELFSGDITFNRNISSNVLKSKFFVCPVCGNIIYSMGEAQINCHGIALKPLYPESVTNESEYRISDCEDEYYIEILHEMTKQHHISFIAALSTDMIQLVKLYPEGTSSARFKRNMVDKILYFCNIDGLFEINLHR